MRRYAILATLLAAANGNHLRGVHGPPELHLTAWQQEHVYHQRWLQQQDTAVNATQNNSTVVQTSDPHSVAGGAAPSIEVPQPTLAPTNVGTNSTADTIPFDTSPEPTPTPVRKNTARAPTRA